jgi:tRNA threonylcarbamoyladenosine biosynthesis protein TsaE
VFVETSHSVAETEAIGERIGRAVQRGAIIGLSGELGAGKTALVRGLARGLGITSHVHSPTFALLNEYHGGRLPLFHLDLYRLGSADEVRAAGLEDYLIDPPGVTVVEWIERWIGDGDAGSCNGPGTLSRLRLAIVEEHTREITHDNPGA